MFRLREQHCAARRRLSGEGTEIAGARGALGSACRRERAEVPQMCKGSSIQSFAGSEAFFPAVCSPIWRLLSAWSGGGLGVQVPWTPAFTYQRLPPSSPLVLLQVSLWGGPHLTLFKCVRQIEGLSAR